MSTPVVMCIGMAGSGKTTFMQRLNSHLRANDLPPYVINLDPAVLNVPFGTNIDIRDSVNYKEVMKQYNLGPNGSIITSLNLFATKIDQILGIVEKRASDVDHVLIDTPGQIECFIWSASGAILLDAFASALPTVIAYIVDTPRTTSPATFMSNMLYACSILYKTKLPMIIVFNKTDVQDSSFAVDWMTDFESFQTALKDLDDEDNNPEGGSGYMNSLMNSMSLVLEEFYRHLDVVSVSAYTGAGMDDFLEAVERKVEEYNTDYKAELERVLKKREEDREKKRQKDLSKLLKDMGIKDSPNESASGSSSKDIKDSAVTISDAEEEDEEEEDEDEFAEQFINPPEAEGILEPDYEDDEEEKD
ncbi:hypothetical protein V1511DRAFT_493727 [Dipodascopsis uninucleata]